MLTYILYSLFILACIVLVVAVLLQPGKSSAGDLFSGGVSSAAFGPRGTASVLAKITIGAEAIAKIKNINAHLCFLGINAIDIKRGTTENDWEIAQLKKIMIDSSRKVVCCTISEKINTLQPIHICNIPDIDILITELPPDAPILKPYVDAGIQVL